MSWKTLLPASKEHVVQEMKSVGVSHNGKHLPADVVVSSLELLDPQAFERLWSAAPQTDSCPLSLSVKDTDKP